jgi:hypothetical protein
MRIKEKLFGSASPSVLHKTGTSKEKEVALHVNVYSVANKGAAQFSPFWICYVYFHGFATNSFVQYGSNKNSC